MADEATQSSVADADQADLDSVDLADSADTNPNDANQTQASSQAALSGDSEEEGEVVHVKPILDNRHLARQLTIQKLYQKQFHELTNLEVQTHERENIGEDLEFENLSRKLEKKLIKSEEHVEATATKIWEKRAEFDDLIAKFAPAWPLYQINPVDLQIIRLAIFEGFVEQSIPSKVAIDEAIELARDFGGEGNIKFVSGVLGSIYNSYKPKE